MILEKLFRTENYEEFIVVLESYEEGFNLTVKDIFEMGLKPYKAIVLFETVD